MEPITISLLLVKMALNFSDTSGSKTAGVLADYLEEVPGAIHDPVSALSRDLSSFPDLQELVLDAINGDALAFTLGLAKLFQSDNNLMAGYMRISSSACNANMNYCPVGRHMMLTPGIMLRPDGSRAPVLGRSWGQIQADSPLMRGRCKRGHRWLVFPATA